VLDQCKHLMLKTDEPGLPGPSTICRFVAAAATAAVSRIMHAHPHSKVFPEPPISFPSTPSFVIHPQSPALNFRSGPSLAHLM
jgi:hypothetical protein